jgi:type VI protein secretion system component Hcp
MEDTMSNLKTIEDAQPFGRELNAQELEQASGGGANKGTGKGTSKGAVEHGDILITKLVDVASP